MWKPVLFFGFCLALLLIKHLHPENRFFNPGGNKTKEEEKDAFLNSTGIFTYDDTGGHIDCNGQKQRFEWNAIKEVIAFKEDHLYMDHIYLHIEMYSNKGFTIHESTPGWFQFITRIEEKIAVSRDWVSKVSFPPFERNETLVYQKPTTHHTA